MIQQKAESGVIMNILSPAILWLIILVVLIVVELMTMGLTTIWFAGGALVAMIIALCHGPIWLQVICFMVVSLAIMIPVRPIAMKYFNSDRHKTNVESLIGQEALVTSEIDNIKALGQVKINGMEWTARTVDGAEKIPAQTIVVVRAISGVKLVVEKAGKQETQQEVQQ